MIIFLVGPVNGNIGRLYENIKNISKMVARPDWVLCTGSFGCWPDPQHLDKATRRHGVGDFPRYYLNGWQAPNNTVFVAGPHEDHDWLNTRKTKNNLEVLKNISWLMNGYTCSIGTIDASVKVLGFGKTYSPNFFTGSPGYIAGNKYYTAQDVQRACSAGPVDILLSHEGIQGNNYGGRKCQSPGVKEIMYATRPKLVVHGHYNHGEIYKTLGITTISLRNEEILPVEWNGKTIKPI